MSDRYWQPAEVEALIPALTGIMDRVREAHREASAARDRLRAEQQRIAMAGGGVVDREAWRADLDALETHTGKVQAGLEEIARLGGTPKDLEMGLVDFPHLRQGRVVNLCWKYGERAIRFWHGLDEGFAGRKPL